MQKVAAYAMTAVCDTPGAAAQRVELVARMIADWLASKGTIESRPAGRTALQMRDGRSGARSCGCIRRERPSSGRRGDRACA